ncbi:hypothetical protein CDAR_495471 [Caerostris darwini]|uniref:Uncharacterized protein n=1 Tax=Caerostris darwini TaxID=1538125 RepID=A0AAV4SCY8_9ARAC|nr:hypothetical protein CDAR_495471 [Caerostris darwini]
MGSEGGIFLAAKGSFDGGDNNSPFRKTFLTVSLARINLPVERDSLEQTISIAFMKGALPPQRIKTVFRARGTALDGRLQVIIVAPLLDH